MHYEEVILVIQRCCSCWQNAHISICALVLYGSILNIKEMLCIMMTQNGCLAGEMLCPHRNWCPQCCCRKGFFPAERGLFCGRRAMSCSHGCLHCLWLRVGTPSSVTVPSSMWGAWLHDRSHFQMQRELLIWICHGFPKAVSCPGLRHPPLRGHRKSPPSWLNFAAKHAHPWCCRRWVLVFTSCTSSVAVVSGAGWCLRGVFATLRLNQRSEWKLINVNMC